MPPAVATTPTDTQVEVVRSFEAPIVSVWSAFTDPESVSRWMQGPPGWSMPVCEMDFRVGGKYENRFRDDDTGLELGLVGEFREIEALRKIVQDERHRLADSADGAPEKTVVTLTFQEAGETTTVTTLVEYASIEARDAALATGMTAAMEGGYRRIDDLLAE
ncbi:MAG: SRPBCC domain-containing protein [Planctomycetota bacterium]